MIYTGWNLSICNSWIADMVEGISGALGMNYACKEIQ
jgi:hypothetical protein